MGVDGVAVIEMIPSPWLSRNFDIAIPQMLTASVQGQTCKSLLQFGWRNYDFLTC